MAVIEIAKIQVRRGQAGVTGLPQLDAGEFGWATDQQKLYIGNGNTDQNGDGAPTVGNTEILTEHTVSNLFNLPNYNYKGNATVSREGFTGPLGSGNTYRTYQQKLDDIVSIADFGVVGDGFYNTPVVNGIGGAPVYQQIQTAIDTIFNNSDKLDPRSRKKLLFPAGTYAITGTIFVPPYANIIGEGADRTVLNVITTASAMQLKDANGLVLESLTAMDHVPGVVIEGVSFRSAAIPSQAQPLLRIDCGTDCQVKQCKFTGTYTSQLTATGYAGVEIRGQGAVTTENLLIEDSVFDSLFYGVASNYDVNDVVITSNKFNNLYTGVAWAEAPATGNHVGPYRSKILHNVFTDVKREGIYVGANDRDNPTNHISSFNSFSNVGGTSTAIITFQSNGNTSIEDRFDRDLTFKTANSTTFYTPSIVGNVFYQPEVAYLTAIRNTALSGASEVTRFPYGGVDQTISMKYSIISTATSYVRKGNLTINPTGVLGGGSTTATVTLADSYTLTPGTSDIDIEFSATIDLVYNTVKILYTALGTNPGSGQAIGQIKYQYSYLK